jgi:hypothetical protein
MTRPWTFLLHQDALEFLDGLRGVEKRRVRAAFLRLAAEPWLRPDAEVRRRGERTLFVREVGSIQIRYWLDGRPQEIVIVEIVRA